VESFLDAAPVQQQLKDALQKQKTNLDTVVLPDGPVQNSNILQFAATIGDVRLMEAVAVHGAAIDFLFLDQSYGQPVTAPTDATALVMVCGCLASYGIMCYANVWRAS
jgi:hypothetical protein